MGPVHKFIPHFADFVARTIEAELSAIEAFITSFPLASVVAGFGVIFVFGVFVDLVLGVFFILSLGLEFRRLEEFVFGDSRETGNSTARSLVTRYSRHRRGGPGTAAPSVAEDTTAVESRPGNQ